MHINTCAYICYHNNYYFDCLDFIIFFPFFLLLLKCSLVPNICKEQNWLHCLWYPEMSLSVQQTSTVIQSIYLKQSNSFKFANAANQTN